MHPDGSTEKHVQWGSPEAIADTSSSSETEGSMGNESALPPVHLTQPDGTVVEINDTDKDQAHPVRPLERVPSWRDNEDLSSAISQNVPTRTISDGQTEVDDHGDDAQLRQGTTIPYTNGTPSLENDFSNVGGASGLGDETPAASYLDLSDSGSEDGDGLWESIDEQLISPPPDDKEYLPLDQLRRIMVKRRVRKALKKHLNLDRDTRYRYACEVCDTTNYGTAKKTTRHKIFAVLVRIEHLEALPSIIEENIHDVHLPFTLQKGDQWHLTYAGVDKVPVKFRASCDWSKPKLSRFIKEQWLFMAPFFDMRATKPHFYPLEAQVVLPFVSDASSTDTAFGGFGDVFQRQIHAAHHNCTEHTQPFFAIKKLLNKDKAEFEDEQYALKKFNQENHPHLTKLLATYYHHEHYYFVFPWADGNLREFWQRYETPKPDHSLIIWLAEQSAGIASGLKLIQHPPQNLELTVQDARDYGRHGDLKPENILWFRDPDAEESLIGSGLLKIADFGLTRYHRQNSRYQKLQSGGGFKCSLTYKAPEVDVVDSVSEAYDIWTLGCLLLEFITWYLRGWQAVDDFSASRANESHDPDHDIPLDTFFNVASKNGVKGAGLKRAVTDLIDDLHDDPNCSKFLHDLLTYTLHHLLRSDYKKRAKCVDVVKMLEKMASDCRNDKSYAVDGRMKPPNKSDTMDTTRTDKTVSEYGRDTAEEDALATPHVSRPGTPTRDIDVHDFVSHDEITERVLDNDVMETDTDETKAAEEPSENDEATPKQGLNVVSQGVGPDDMDISTPTTRNTSFLQEYSFSSSGTESYVVSQSTESGFGENPKRKSCDFGEEASAPEVKRPKFASGESTLVGSTPELSERSVAQSVEA
ncbi:protein kinase domain-containing protein [Colletotrichum kahawae]|uniref:Protein kinase domain-containing protein n=1 Tax=Colletotrichum kahawae TaxID=34407 RepID=A0AAE0DA98_COLKA|nr:protein kinase domain-containing protein [Colletotrichum kahawae]